MTRYTDRNQKKLRKLKRLNSDQTIVEILNRTKEQEGELPYALYWYYHIGDAIKYYAKHKTLPEECIDTEVESWLRDDKPKNLLTTRDKAIIARMGDEQH